MNNELSYFRRVITFKDECLEVTANSFGLFIDNSRLPDNCIYNPALLWSHIEKVLAKRNAPKELQSDKTYIISKDYFYIISGVANITEITVSHKLGSVCRNFYLFADYSSLSIQYLLQTFNPNDFLTYSICNPQFK